VNDRRCGHVTVPRSDCPIIYCSPCSGPFRWSRPRIRQRPLQSFRSGSLSGTTARSGSPLLSPASLFSSCTRLLVIYIIPARPNCEGSPSQISDVDPRKGRKQPLHELRLECHPLAAAYMVVPPTWCGRVSCSRSSPHPTRFLSAIFCSAFFHVASFLAVAA